MPEAENSADIDLTHEQTPDDYEKEMAALEAEEIALERQLKMAEKKRKIDQLKAKLKQTEMPGDAHVIAPGNASGGEFGDGEAITNNAGVTLTELRAMEGLQHAAEKIVGSLDVQGAGCSEGNDISCTLNAGSKQKSGKEARTTDHVKAPLRWPHIALKYNMGQSQMSYSSLDFASLVAGEVAIINSPETSPEERRGRLELLQTVAYHTRAYSWSDVLNFHGTCLLEIEKGERVWGGRETFIAVEASTLYAQPRRQSKRVGEAGTERKWFCKQFQLGTCRHDGSHEAMVQGKLRTVHHICATCLQKDGSAKAHAENTSACPHAHQ